jgi:hypothetical protein
MSSKEDNALEAELERNEKDAARYRWLAARFLGADFDWNEQAILVLCFEMDKGMRISADIGTTIDSAILAADKENP